MGSGGRDFAPAGLFQQYPPKADDPLSVAIRRGGNGCFSPMLLIKSVLQQL
jgi:hypothetical protein